MSDRTPDVQAFEDTIQLLKQEYYKKDDSK